LAARVGLAAAAVAALVAIAIPLGTTTRVRDSQSDARAGHLDAAADSARSAQRLEPGAASPRIQQALVLELRGDFEGAARDARVAVAKEPVNWRSWVVLSRLEAERGDAPAAVAAFRRARALNPRSDLFQS
jgi:Tfp pilus assembly protein PilF